SPATRLPPASAISLTTTLAPSSAKRLAIASPKPEPPPVTTATLFSSRMMSSLSRQLVPVMLCGNPGNTIRASCVLRLLAPISSGLRAQDEEHAYLIPSAEHALAVRAVEGRTDSALVTDSVAGLNSRNTE